jgi:hypothetical protein
VSSWRWEYGWEYSDEPISRTSMDVLVPDPTKTIEPFGFARAFYEPSADPEYDAIYSVFGATGMDLQEVDS